MPAADRLAAIFAGADPTTLFTPVFLAQVSPQQISALIANIRSQHGSLVSVEHGSAGNGWRVRLERAALRVDLHLDDQRRVDGLFLHPAVPLGRSIGAVMTSLRALPGDVSALVVSDGEVRSAHEPDRPLAVGSAFKLILLAALQDQVRRRVTSPETVLTLQEADRSLPSGILQTWPANVPLTVASLAILMVSQSDNTAADMLARHVGRAALDACSVRNAPFLTTREMFVLRGREQSTLRDRWLGAEPEARRALLTEIEAAPLPDAAAIASFDGSAPIEWLLSAAEIAHLLDGLAGEPALGVNAGPIERDDWARFSYKGGSDRGVLNVSLRVVSTSGRTHTVIVTWNDAEADNHERLLPLVRELLEILRTET